MSVLFTFPGQGAQRRGMLAELPDSAPVRETRAEAEDVLSRTCASLDTSEALATTDNVQLALTVAGVAAARHLCAEAGAPDAVLGLSIGAWPAAVIAGVVDFDVALGLVAERGRLMGEAYPSGYGMLAVLGLSEQAVSELVDALQAENHAVYVANVNADQQIVAAGRDDALALLADRAQDAGARAVKRLAVAVPSHCALLDGPAARLADIGADVAWRAPRCAYFSANARRRLYRGADVGDDLLFNMARTVYWAQTARIASESGMGLAVEMPPGATLTGLHPAGEGDSEAIAVERSGWHNSAALIRRAAQTRGP
ncbi:acyltransferase domain-containing protein [uncultured Salinisphaera sp.]|uniref:ACP S-malonyltransferase n=1 Tax=uncultured Salinisphaera sp. TaxID=359372 RepID=UPI0032B1649D|tara:strand:+ start:2820 stop:3758 length:939 start_codon:yes stop_codon:yes gene_type:complete